MLKFENTLGITKNQTPLRLRILLYPGPDDPCFLINNSENPRQTQEGTRYPMRFLQGSWPC